MKSRITLLLLCLLIPMGACHKKSKTGTPSPPQPPHTVIAGTPTPSGPLPNPRTMPVPEPLPPPAPPTLLQRAESYFDLGDYDNAVRGFDEYLKRKSEPRYEAAALFYLGLSRILSGGSARDLRQAEVEFKRLIAGYPKTPYAAQAAYILELQGQIERLRVETRDRDEKIKQLTDELDKLKQIDMQRRPTRPPPE
jgi:TolA-binding protein